MVAAAEAKDPAKTANKSESNASKSANRSGNRSKRNANGNAGRRVEKGPVSVEPTRPVTPYGIGPARCAVWETTP